VNDKETLLTKEGLRKLEEELEELKTVHRKEVNDRIRHAKEFGDISENAEYEDAKQEQAFVEGRILKLETMIRNAKIIDDVDMSISEIGFGATVKIKDTKAGTTLDLTIVGSAEANPPGGMISNESPLGNALMGHKKGDSVEVTTPRGVVVYKVEAVNGSNTKPNTKKATAKKAS
jgi:transcription elongation factor GreA